MFDPLRSRARHDPLAIKSLFVKIKKTPPSGWSSVSHLYRKGYGLNRNLSFPRLAANFAFRRTFWEGVSKARKRRTSSIMPSASSLFFSLLSALSIGSPFLTITSGIKILILRMLFRMRDK
jgi:hypothetical protein